MQLVNDIYDWIDRVLFVVAVALRLWAIIDCAFRKAKAFTAVNKLTKLAWLAILVVSGALGSWQVLGPTVSLVSLASLVVALVYLCDVRPAVREVSGGR